MRFKDKIVAITGGNSGIGFATATKFKKEGAKLAIFGRDIKTLNKASDILGKDVLIYQGSVSNLQDLEAFFLQIKSSFGKLDHLVVNAGVSENKGLLEVTEDHFNKHFDINVKGAFFTAQKAIPLFPKQGGTIVLVSSVVHFRGWADFTVYTATKAAVRSFARTMSRDLLPQKIRVNSISPGGVLTPIIDRMGFSQEEVTSWAETVPLKRYGNPDEIADGILFLSGQESSYIIGIDLLVDGGKGELDL